VNVPDLISSLWSAGSPPQLLGSRDRLSGELRFPAHLAQSPLAAASETVELQSCGSIYSFTRIHPNPKTGQAPFCLGYVDLDGPVRVMGRIEGEQVRIGARCKAAPNDQLGYVFVVDEESGDA
jgi:hypothetical protein